MIDEMVRPLPPLSSLRMFEAAARHLSFRAAADELGVSPSAVSHGIVALERSLDARLFIRGTKSLGLSKAAMEYLPAVRRALGDLTRATEALPGRSARHTLKISAAPTFASAWLLPRMPRFAKNAPNVAISLDTERRQINLPLQGIDLVIRMAARRQSGGIWHRLVRERLVPVVAPALWHQIRHRSIADILAETPRIHVTTVRRDWNCFADGAACPARNSRSDLRFDTIQMAMEAAAYGLGIALGRRPLVDDDLACGRLTALPVPERDAASSYWLVALPSTLERPEVKAFRRWLLSELRSSLPVTP